jgi:hypothetical protein
MERLKNILSFAGGVAGLLAFMFGVNLLVDCWGLAFVVGAYVAMFLALLAGFVIFDAGLGPRPPSQPARAGEPAWPGQPKI